MPSAPKWVFDTLDYLVPKLPSIEITNTEYVSPFVKKIRLQGDFNKYIFPVGTFFDLRVSDTEARRYTVAQINPEKKQVDLIAHIHGKGSGSHYIDSLNVGDMINLNKPRTDQKYYDKSAEKFVIFGDETTLALACSFLPILKMNAQDYLFLLELDEENKAVPALLGIDNYLIYPKKDSFRNEDWISTLPVITSSEWQDAYFILTGNVRSAQAFRKVIKKTNKGKVRLYGYWLEGKKGL